MFKNNRMMQQLLQQAQKAQKQLEIKLKEFDQKEFDHTFGSDHVQITLKGNLQITRLIINDQLMSDKDMLQEVLTDAVNEAISKVSEDRVRLQESLLPKSPGFGF